MSRKNKPNSKKQVPKKGWPKKERSKGVCRIQMLMERVRNLTTN